MGFKLFLDKDGKPQFDDKGLPLFMQDGATEPVGMDVNLMIDDNRAKKTAADAAKREKDELAAKLKQFEGVEPEAARLALEQVKRGGAPAGQQESEEMRRIKALEDALKKAEQEKAAIKAEQEKREIDRLIEEEFNSSNFAAEHSHIPLDFWLARYRNHCAFEEHNGIKTLVFKDGNGNVVMSEKTPGLPAKKDEALSILCAARPKPGDIRLNPAPFGGSGTQPSQRSFASSNPWAKGQENLTQQHKIMAEDPALAQRLAASAGVQLSAF